MLPQRKPDSNKGTYGKVLMITGSKGMSGAAYLSARAAYLSGAGLVRIYTEESNRAILQELLPEAVMTTYSLDETESFEELPDLLEWADVLCIGCGLGMGPHSEELLKKVLENNKTPAVIDADGLNLLAKTDEWGIEQIRMNPSGYVLTPHMKEMSRLTGYSVQELKDNRRELLRKYTEKVHAVCRRVDLMYVLAVQDLMAKILVDGIDIGVVLCVDDGERLGGLIGKLLLDDEGHRDLVALVEVLVGDKAVHLRPQRDRLDERGHDQMEHRIGEFRFCFILFLEIRVHIGEVDRLADVGLIVAAVRVDQRRNEVHPVEITEQHTIFPVAPATFFLFHFKSHTFLTESRQQCLYDTKERQEMQA